MRRTSLLCLVLLCVSGVAQALHTHSQDLARSDSDKTRCTICVAGDSPQQAVAPVQVPSVEAQESVIPASSAGSKQHIGGETSRIRPPPSL